MSYPCIYSEGGLIPAYILEQIAAGEAPGQTTADFGLPRSARLTNEIAAAWADARVYWEAFQHGLRRLPDHAQPHLADYPARPDFYYEDARACVFCDGSVHDQPDVQAEDQRVRAALADLGYRVVVIRYDRDLEEQVGECRDVFGEGS